MKNGAVIAALFLLFFSLAAFAKALEDVTIVTAAGNRTVKAEIADTEEKRSYGLMFRRSMPPDQGMLFFFGRERVIDMWMKNTYLPLDMIFIRADGRIHSIAANTEPLSEEIVSSGGPASAVLELNAGAAARLGIRPGDAVQHPRLGKPVQ